MVPVLPQPSVQRHRPPTATRSTTWAPRSSMPGRAARRRARRRAAVLVVAHPARRARPRRRSRRWRRRDRPRRPPRPCGPPRRGTSPERSTRITQPISPSSTVTSTRDFSGTNPRTAGSAAMSLPGLLREKSALGKVVMRRTSQRATSTWACVTPITPPDVDESASGDEGRCSARIGRWLTPSACKIVAIGVGLLPWVPRRNTTSSSSVRVPADRRPPSPPPSSASRSRSSNAASCSAACASTPEPFRRRPCARRSSTSPA